MFGSTIRAATALLMTAVAVAAGGTATATAAPGVRAPVPEDAVCAPVAAADAAPFAANTNRVGLVDLHFFNADGAAVTFVECVGGRAHRLGTRTAPGAPITSMLAATPWRCGRLTRHFAATATLAGGARVRGITSVRTMSCAHRFALEPPRRVARGQPARVRIVDRWGLGGIRTRLCLTAPRGRRHCRPVDFPAAAGFAARRFRPDVRGLWRVELQVLRYRVRGAVAVGVRGPRVTAAPALLATGDSTMQGVESSLADDLGAEANVLSDVRPGFSISRTDGWTAIARAQVARHRPRTTVISLGAAEGFPMRTGDGSAHECCDAAWTAEYTARVRRAMRIYRQGGRARVFWLTIPAPRAPTRVPIVDAVNRAIVRAARGLSGVSVLRMDLLFSPDGYQERLRYRGRDVAVREPDGIHLNASGTAIEAREAAQAVRGRATVVPGG